MDLKSSSELLHVGSFLQKWQKVLDNEDMILHAGELEKSKVAKYLDQPVDVVTELDEFCNDASLVCPAEKKLCELENVSLKGGVPVGGFSLDTLRIRCVAVKRNPSAPSQFYVSPKFSRGYYDMVHNHLQAEIQKDVSTASVQVSKVLLQVILFKAFRKFAGQSLDAWKETDIWKEREFLILTDQKLTELRDKISCASDMAWVSSDVSENPDVELTERAQELYPSNFFFIENTFYPDLRNPLSTDISSPIQDWLKNNTNRPEGDLCNIQVKPMTEVTFNDLYIRLGYPYLYCHQGNCEHLVVFSDIRLMHGDDCQDPTMYPLMINKPQKKRLLCMICKAFCSKWMTRNDSFTPSDPTFQCDTCFRMLHYDEYGKKLGTFEAYPYIDSAVFS